MNRALFLRVLGVVLLVVGVASGLLAASDYESVDGSETPALWVAAFWVSAGPGLVVGAIAVCTGLLIETIEVSRRR